MKVVKGSVTFNIYKKVSLEYGLFSGVGYRNRAFIKHIRVKDLIMFSTPTSSLIKKISVAISIMYR